MSNILETIAAQAKHDEYKDDPNHSCDMCEPEPREYRIISTHIAHRVHDILAKNADDARNQVLQGLDQGEGLEREPVTIKSCWDKADGRFV
jgi:hypothetical protein